MNLYGDWAALPQSSIIFIEQTITKENYDTTFEEIRDSEIVNKTLLQDFETDYPGVLTENNLDDILQRATQKMSELEASEHDEVSEGPIQKM